MVLTEIAEHIVRYSTILNVEDQIIHSFIYSFMCLFIPLFLFHVTIAIRLYLAKSSEDVYRLCIEEQGNICNMSAGRHVY